MQVRVLALDFDGTIATGDRLHPEVRAAIGEARARGLAVVLATGRRLEALRACLGDLRIFDAIVAENGAVVHFPDSERSIFQAASVSEDFVDSLRRHGVSVTTGVCIVEAEARDACTILDEIRRRNEPLAILFNGQRAMVLPQGISKGTGLLSALGALRLSAHNAIGIGDAENDHSLLESCELGLAVGWGSQHLQKVADVVLPGAGPSAVAAYIRSLLKGDLAMAQPGRRRLRLGENCGGSPFELALRDRNVLIVGDPRSGKSWLAGLLVEELILLGYCVCVLDPEGDYATLSSLPRVISVGGEEPAPHPRDIWRALRYPDASVVVDMSHHSLEEKRLHIAKLLPVLMAMRSEMGFPHRILLDEAHYFLADSTIRNQLHLETGGYILATHRVDQLPAEAMRHTEVVLATRVTDRHELEALSVYHTRPQVEAIQSVLAKLALDEAVLLPGAAEAGGHIRHIHLVPRLTMHVRHRQKYVDMPVLARHAFVFTRGGASTGQRATTLAEFVKILRASSEDVVAGHARRGDISRWIRDVFGDVALADDLRRIERRARAHDHSGLGEAIASSVEERYGSAGP